MTEIFEWHKLRVHRDDRFETLVEKFCSTKNSSNTDVVFSTIKELMVFAALVGFQLDEFEPLQSKSNCISISMETYATTKHDAYIYLLALAKKTTLDILKDQHLKEAITIFEGYCNAGLKHIDNWIINNLGEPILEDILFNQTLIFLSDNE
jgi:dnd system-associated protein 4